MYKVIFDIDNTIAWTFYPPAPEFIEEFQNRNLFFTALLPHILFPGVIELIQALDKYPDIQIGFFSTGTKERNELFVEQLLCLALGRTRYNELKPTLVIGSRHNLSATFHKDLTAVSDDIENTIILDDLPYNFTPQQIGNLLKINSITGDVFEDLYHLCKHQLATKNNWLSFNIDKNLNSESDAFIKANQIFYAAGVLFSALENAKREAISLKSALINIQFRDPNSDQELLVKIDQNPKRIDQEKKLTNEPRYYLKGLQILTNENSTLRFVDEVDFLHNYRINTNGKIEEPVTPLAENTIFEPGENTNTLAQPCQSNQEQVAETYPSPLPPAFNQLSFFSAAVQSTVLAIPATEAAPDILPEANIDKEPNSHIIPENRFN